MKQETSTVYGNINGRRLDVDEGRLQIDKPSQLITPNNSCRLLAVKVVGKLIHGDNIELLMLTLQ